jgi:hypothetical protein
VSPAGSRDGRAIPCRTLIWILVLTVCWCVSPTRPALADEIRPPAGASDGSGVEIRQLRIQVLPEFDDPRVLVIAQGRLDVADSALPLAATFRVPEGAQINQMATMDMLSGGTTPQPFETRPDPEDTRWLLVTYVLDNAHFFFEYYDAPPGGGPDKEVPFVYSSLYTVQDLLVEVQQPRAASNLNVSPSPAASRVDEAMGLTYHLVEMGALAAGGETAVRVRYTKTDPAPSLSRAEIMETQMGRRPLQAQPPAFAPERTSENLPSWLVTLVCVAALAVLVALIAGRIRSEGALPGRPQEASSGAACRGCGTVPRANAYFCHVCGRPRTPEIEQHGFV